MNNSFFKSIVSATTTYFSPKRQSSSNTAQNQQPRSSPETLTRRHTLMAPDSTGRKQIFKDIVYYDASSSLDEEHRLALHSGGAVEYSGTEISSGARSLMYLLMMLISPENRRLLNKRDSLL